MPIRDRRNPPRGPSVSPVVTGVEGRAARTVPSSSIANLFPPTKKKPLSLSSAGRLDGSVRSIHTIVASLDKRRANLANYS